MKRTIKLAVAAAVALTSTAAFATNGDNLIAVGAKARGMGGVGIGMSHGAESALSNPALISTVKGTEISFGGTVFMPDVSYDGGAGYKNSDATLSVIPEVAVAQNLGNGVTWGVGMFGTAGMGTDYREDATGSTLNMVTNLQLMQFAVPVAYKIDALTVAIAPVLQYGALDINYDFGGNVGAGVAQDLGYGYILGAAYEISGLTLGATYKSSIDMSYKGQLSGATAPFATAGVFAAPMEDHLEQPAEIGVGASYVMGESTFAVDFKQVKWADAKGYKDFKWSNQDVYAVGYQYAGNGYAVRLGYNHGSSPISDQGGTGGASGTGAEAALNMFNLLGFPATVEDHYTVGGSLALNKTTSVDLAYTYAPEVTDTFTTGDLGGMGMAPTVSTKHSQQAASVQLNFNF